MPEILLKDQLVTYTLRRSKRARKMGLRVNRDGLRVTIPDAFDGDIKDLEPYIRSKEDWILRHLNNPTTRQPRPQRQYDNGETLPFVDEAVTLEIHQSDNKYTTVKRDGTVVIIRLRADITQEERHEELRAAVETWYRNEAKRYIPARVAELAEQMELDYNRVFIKNQKTRWGSCSTLGNLNFNLRLMMAPSHIIDYLIVHELCHLWEQNHSARFWAHVEQYCPDYKERLKWLRQNERLLHL